MDRARLDIKHGVRRLDVRKRGTELRLCKGVWVNGSARFLGIPKAVGSMPDLGSIAITGIECLVDNHTEFWP